MKRKLPAQGLDITVSLENHSAMLKGPLADVTPKIIHITGRVVAKPEWETDPNIFCLFVAGSDVPVRHIRIHKVVAINGVNAGKFLEEAGMERHIVRGSKGDEYVVLREGDHWTCTCTGFHYRGKCKHIDGVRK